jgi:hypothetical protein
MVWVAQVNAWLVAELAHSETTEARTGDASRVACSVVSQAGLFGALHWRRT